MNGAEVYLQNKYSSKEDKTTELVTKYAYLVKKIALHLKSRLPHSVQLDDLIQHHGAEHDGNYSPNALFTSVNRLSFSHVNSSTSMDFVS